EGFKIDQVKTFAVFSLFGTVFSKRRFSANSQEPLETCEAGIRLSSSKFPIICAAICQKRKRVVMISSPMIMLVFWMLAVRCRRIYCFYKVAYPELHSCFYGNKRNFFDDEISLLELLSWPVTLGRHAVEMPPLLLNGYLDGEKCRRTLTDVSFAKMAGKNRITFANPADLLVSCESVFHRGFYADHPMMREEAELPIAYARVVFRVCQAASRDDVLVRDRSTLASKLTFIGARIADKYCNASNNLFFFSLIRPFLRVFNKEQNSFFYWVTAERRFICCKTLCCFTELVSKLVGLLERFAIWRHMKGCSSSEFRHAVCTSGTEDLPKLMNISKLIANKMLPEFDSCWMQTLFNLTYGNLARRLNLEAYSRLPYVCFNRERERRMRNPTAFNCTFH
uniref:Uncharacterized protein n=1 Tax=Ascaris lumbricoides TaxID=6252 RepID=A0A9J2PN13_ASCLU